MRIAPSATVLVAAQPSLYRQGLLATLQDTWPDLRVLLTPDSQQLPLLLRQQRYALVILDIDLPGPPLPELLTRLHAIRREQHLLLITGQRLPPGIRHHLLQDNSNHLLPRNASPHHVVLALRTWLTVSDEAANSCCLSPPRPCAPPTPFSRRELEVLRLVVQDHCNQEIADELCLSVRTVESHRRALLQKAGARTLVGLAVQAVREGWVAV